MPLALFLAGASQGNSLIKQTVVADNCRLSDYNSVSVVNKQAFSYFCSGMDFYAGKKAHHLRDKPRDKRDIQRIEKMG